jgi:hypothetical protein
MWEHLAICMVEIGGTLTGKFKVLMLIMPDWDMSRSDDLALALLVRSIKSCGKDFKPTNLCMRMSAAWRTGYEKSPSLREDPTLLSSRLDDDDKLSLLWTVLFSVRYVNSTKMTTASPSTVSCETSIRRKLCSSKST